MVFYSRIRVPAVAIVLSLIFCFNPSMPALPSDQKIRTMVNLLVLHVSVLDNKTQRPIQGLRNQDFEVFDNGAALQPVVYFAGLQPGSKPTPVWFVLGCPFGASLKVDSDWSKGAVKSALVKLASDNIFGVGDWCGNEANIDLSPTADREAALAAIDAVLRRTPGESSGTQINVGFQRLLRLIVDASNLQNDRPSIAIVVLNDQKVSVAREEAEITSKRLLYDNVVLYQVKKQPKVPEQKLDTLALICKQTGGRTYSVERETYEEAIESILASLRFRYTIGVFPVHGFDHQWHQVRVQLTGGAQKEHRYARVDYGAGYLAGGSYSISNYKQTEDAAIIEDEKAHEIDFAAGARGFAGLDHLVKFDLTLKSDQLTWGNLTDGYRQSPVVVTFTSYSEDGRPLGQSAARFEILRDEAHLPITGDVPFTHSDTITLPDNVSTVRMAVNDVSTGRIGFKDFSMREILAGPREPAVLR